MFCLFRYPLGVFCPANLRCRTPPFYPRFTLARPELITFKSTAIKPPSHFEHVLAVESQMPARGPGTGLDAPFLDPPSNGLPGNSEKSRGFNSGHGVIRHKFSPPFSTCMT